MPWFLWLEERGASIQHNGTQMEPDGKQHLLIPTGLTHLGVMSLHRNPPGHITEFQP